MWLVAKVAKTIDPSKASEALRWFRYLIFENALNRYLTSPAAIFFPRLLWGFGRVDG